MICSYWSVLEHFGEFLKKKVELQLASEYETAINDSYFSSVFCIENKDAFLNPP